MNNKNLYVFLSLLFAVVTLWGQKTNSTHKHFPGKKLAQEQLRISDAKFMNKNLELRGIFRIKQKVFGKNYEEKAKSFFRQEMTAFKMDRLAIDDFKMQQVHSSSSGAHVKFQQVYKEVPVYGADMVLSINNNDEVTMVLSNYKSALNLATVTPKLTSEQVIARSLKYLEVDSAHIIGTPKTKLMILKKEEQSVLIYKVNIVAIAKGINGDFELLVCAQDGEIFAAENLIKNHSPNISQVDGQGYIFNPDPLTNAGKKYGDSGFIDANDSDNDLLNENRELVTLRGLSFDGTFYTLENNYVALRDFEGPDDNFPSLTDPNGFLYTRSQQQFEMVNVFYHINESMRYIEDLGFTIRPQAYEGGVRVDPHGLNGDDNSHFIPSRDLLAFGEGGVDDAEDADVILHELGHAIQDFVVPGFRGEEGLGEGFGDYWAESYSRSLQKWTRNDDAYFFVFGWDGHNEFWGGRTTNFKGHYPEDLNSSVHHDGQLWSTPLLQLHEILGGKVMDMLVLKSHFYLTANANQVANAEAILQADKDLFNGEHREVIIEVLGNYGQLSHLLNKK